MRGVESVGHRPVDTHGKAREDHIHMGRQERTMESNQFGGESSGETGMKIGEIGDDKGG
jgi:hypothetical protein